MEHLGIVDNLCADSFWSHDPLKRKTLELVQKYLKLGLLLRQEYLVSKSIGCLLRRYSHLLLFLGRVSLIDGHFVTRILYGF